MRRRRWCRAAPGGAITRRSAVVVVMTVWQVASFRGNVAVRPLSEQSVHCCAARRRRICGSRLTWPTHRPSSKPTCAFVDPPFDLMKSVKLCPTGFAFRANRRTRDHLLRVLASATSGSEVQNITIANGSGFGSRLSSRGDRSLGPFACLIAR